MQHLRLGQALRARYVTELGFLPAEFDPTVVYLRSTDVPRTIQSAQSLIAGLFPDAATSSASVPVLTIHTMDGDGDNMTPNTGLCPRLAELEVGAALPPRSRRAPAAPPTAPTVGPHSTRSKRRCAPPSSMLQCSPTCQPWSQWLASLDWRMPRFRRCWVRWGG